MKKRISFIFIVFVAWSAVAMGQPQTTAEKIVLTNKSVGPNSNLHSIFFMLSVNNQKNINNQQIDISYSQTIQSSPAEIKFSWNNISASGDIFFRDFNFDTLIIPDIVQITLSRMDSNEKYPLQQQFKSTFPARTFLLKPYNYKNGKVSIHLDWYLSDAKFEKFVTATKIANAYYGSYSVLKAIANKDKETDQISSYLNYIEIYRALYLIDKQNIIKFLQLKQHDPIRFLPLYYETLRQKIRARTLALQQINEDTVKNSSNLFARALVKLSVNFLTKKSHLQPYFATSYEKMARIAVDTTIFKFYSNICNQYDSKNQTNIPCAQKVFNEFMAQAAKYEQTDADSYSLIMLSNAEIWANEMKGVISEPVFVNQLATTIDGMMTSYAKVASVSFVRGNQKMGLRYMDKANDLYKSETRQHPKLLKKPLPQYQFKLLQIAKDEVNISHYQNAIDLLNLYKNLPFNKQQQKEKYNILSFAYLGIFNRSIKAAKTALENGYTDEAYRRMLAINDFRKTYSKYLSSDTAYNDKLQKTAYGLILEYIKRGEILMDQHRSGEAMDDFGIALGLQNEFLSYRVDRLDELMNQTALPILLKKIKKAELLVWSNKLDEANSLFSDIKRIEARFHLEDNSLINQKVAALKLKLKNRKCVDAKYALSNFTEVAQNRVHTGKWDEAVLAMENADKVLKLHKSCELDSSLYIGLRRNNNDVFEYISAYKKAKTNLYAYGYDSVWKTLADLDTFYNQHNLSDLGVPKPGQYEILKSQHNSQNIIRIVNYYISQNNSEQAYHYLLLLEEFDLRLKSVKKLQKAIGRQMAQNISITKFNSMVDTSDKWLRPLIDSYYSVIE